MDRGAWRAAVHGIARVGYDLVTLPSPPISRQTWGLECVVPSGRGSDSTALSHGTRPPTAQGRGGALLMGPGGLCQASGLDALPPPGPLPLLRLILCVFSVWLCPELGVFSQETWVPPNAKGRIVQTSAPGSR